MTRRSILLLATLTLFVSGCTPYLESQYLAPNRHSINGIDAFVTLIRGTGRKVQIWRSVSARMKTDVDALIVFQHEFDQIPNDRLRSIRQLIRESDIKMVVFIPRDSDCAIDYWKQIGKLPNLTVSEEDSASDALEHAIQGLRLDADDPFEPKDAFYGLKKEDRTNQPDVITVEMVGDTAPTKVEARWPLNRRLEPAEDARVGWSTGDDEALLTTEVDYTGKTILVLASAAPVLNGGLVDPGNRRLAEVLVKLLPQGKIAVTLSSRWSEGNFAESPGILTFLKVHPHGWIFGQTFLAILLFCWWKLPIFGRPLVAVNAEPVRFGRHVEALGQLLLRTRDAPHARQLIRDWQRVESRRAKSETNTSTTSANVPKRE